MPTLFALVAALLMPAVLAAADLRVTDRSGTQTIVKDASIDYPGALGAALRESKGIRVQQGDATVTVKWKDIASLTIGGDGDASARGAGTSVEVVLRNGRRVAASLPPRDATLRGKTELGEYSLDLGKVRAIEPLR
jgi:hypothetical protein